MAETDPAPVRSNNHKSLSRRRWLNSASRATLLGCLARFGPCALGLFIASRERVIAKNNLGPTGHIAWPAAQNRALSPSAPPTRYFWSTV